MRGSQITFLALYLIGEWRHKRPMDHVPLSRIHREDTGLDDMALVDWVRPRGATIQSSMVPKIALQIAQSILTLEHIYIFKGGFEPEYFFWSVERPGSGDVLLQERDTAIALEMMEMARKIS